MRLQRYKKHQVVQKEGLAYIDGRYSRKRPRNTVTVANLLRISVSSAVAKATVISATEARPSRNSNRSHATDGRWIVSSGSSGEQIGQGMLPRPSHSSHVRHILSCSFRVNPSALQLGQDHSTPEPPQELQRPERAPSAASIAARFVAFRSSSSAAARSAAATALSCDAAARAAARPSSAAARRSRCSLPTTRRARRGTRAVYALSLAPPFLLLSRQLGTQRGDATREQGAKKADCGHMFPRTRGKVSRTGCLLFGAEESTDQPDF
jgi:hypothetical protein